MVWFEVTAEQKNVDFWAKKTPLVLDIGICLTGDDLECGVLVVSWCTKGGGDAPPP